MDFMRKCFNFRKMPEKNLLMLSEALPYASFETRKQTSE